MRICLQNLGQYNEGILNFKWVDLPIDEDELKEALEEIGVEDGGQYEEYMIADYEAPFQIGEYDSIEKLNDIVEEYGKVFELYEEAIEDLNKYDCISAGFKIMELCGEINVECEIVEEDYLIEDVKRYAEEGAYLSIKNLVWDVSGAEDNTLVFIEGDGNYRSLYASGVRDYLDGIMSDFKHYNLK